jgi:putative FmdB family regulatory protein
LHNSKRAEKDSDEGGMSMPTYEFRCKKCKKEFTAILSLREYEKGKISCPKCKGKQVQQMVSHFMTKTSRKS